MRGLVAAACCAAAAAVAATPAMASWSAPAVVSPAGENSIDPQVAMNEHGDAVLVWKHRVDDYHSAVELVSRNGLDGGFSAPAVISTEADQQNFEPHVALDPAGNAVVMWAETSPSGDIIRAAAGRVGGAFAHPVTIGGETGSAGSHDSCIGVDTAGQVTAFWTQGDSNFVHYATRPPNGSFSAAQTIPNPGDRVEWPDCAVSANGDAFVTWTDGLRVLAATRPAGSDSFSVQTLAPFDSSKPLASVSRLASNASGQAIVTWSQSDSSSTTYNRASWRPAGGSFGAPETFGRTGGGGTEPVIAPDGEATLVGVAGYYQQPARDGIGAVVRSADGHYGPYEQMSANGWEDDPAMAFDSAGDLFAAWRRYYDRSTPDGIAYAVVRPADGPFPATETPISADGRNVWGVVLAAGPAGHALAAWPRGTFPDDFHIELSEYGAPATPDAPAGSEPNPTPAPRLTNAESPSPTPRFALRISARHRIRTKHRLMVALTASQPTSATLVLRAPHDRPLAHEHARLGANHRRLVALRLTRSAVATLSRSGKLVTDLQVVATDAAQDKASVERRVVLRWP